MNIEKNLSRQMNIEQKARKHGQESAHNLDYIQSPLQLMDYLFLFHKEVLLRQWKHSKHLYIHVIPLPHLTLQMCAPFLCHM